jgi:hypothetical protein
MNPWPTGSEWGACPTCGAHCLHPAGRGCDACDPLIPLAQWCGLNGVRVRTAYDWIRLGKLPRVVVGGRSLVPQETAVPTTRVGRPRG